MRGVTNIRAAMILDGWSVTKLNEALNERNGTDFSPQNLSNRLSKGNIRYNEAVEIAAIMGYRIDWVEKHKD